VTLALAICVKNMKKGDGLMKAFKGHLGKRYLLHTGNAKNIFGCTYYTHLSIHSKVS